MSDDLILQPRTDGRVIWSVIDRQSGARRGGGVCAAGDALTLAATETVTRTLCLLPSEQVFVSRIELAAKGDAEARQAAPFMIEDELASRLEDTLVLAGPRDEAGRRRVLAAASDVVAGWLDRLGPVLVRPVHTLPDCLAIGDLGAGLSLYDRGDAVLYRFGEAAHLAGKPAGGAIDPQIFGRVVSALVRQAGNGRIAVSPALGLTGENFTGLRCGELDLAASALPDSLLQELPALFGEMWRSTLDWTSVGKPMRRAGWLAACAALGFALLLGGEAMYFQHQAQRFDTASLALFQHTVPDVTRRIVPAEAERILQARIAGLGGGDASSFLQLTAALAELVAQNERVRIDHLRFDQARGELSVSAIYSDFSDFDALSQQAARLGLQLRDGGARESDGGIEGEFVVAIR
ncbi:MAG: general secretion pathway protein L [Maricaulis sp.]|jgi:general secretion pathway protein L